jgi:signal transduction histidine kinase
MLIFIDYDTKYGVTDLSYTAGVQLNDGAWVVIKHSVPKSEQRFITHPLITLDISVRIISMTVIILLGVHFMTRPLTILANAADKLGEDIHQPPLPETGPREIVRAAKAFNRMQARIRAFIDERGRMLAAVSHDLKTPITRMRLRADHIAAPDLQEQFVADLDEMREMLDMSIEFVRSTDNGEGLAEVDVMALLESLADDYAEMGGPVRVCGTAGAPLRAQPLHLKRCLANLIENGVRYGGEVDIEVRDTPAAMTIVIGDNGPGIPPELLEKVFEPFFRVESSRSRSTGGNGLGLSIARNIARLHGGDVVLANKPEGGLESRLTLPRTCAK